MALDGRYSDSVDFEKWKNHDFPRGTRARPKFEYLCSQGCNPKILLSFLNLAVLQAGLRRTVYDVYGVSRSELLKLPDRLEEVSHQIDHANRFLSCYIQANFLDNPHLPAKTRSAWRRQALVYRWTPELLRLLAGHIRSANKWVRDNAGPKKVDTFRQLVLQLLEYVDISTKRPHYDEIAELLDHLFSVKWKAFKTIINLSRQQERTTAKKKKDGAPSAQLISPEALRALYHRSGKHGFRKACPQASKLHSA